MTFLNTLLLLLLGVGASLRLTRLIVADTITQPFRSWVSRHTKEPEYVGNVQVPDSGSKIAYLVHCAWCSGLWVALGVAVLLWFGGLAELLPLDWWAAIPVVALFLGHAVGLLQRLDR